MNTIHQQRIARVRRALVEQELDALLVSIQENRFYLSGFCGEDGQFDESAGVLIISTDNLVLATDSRYELQARKEAGAFQIVCYRNGLARELPQILETLNIQRLGFESTRLSHKNHQSYVKALAEADANVELVGTEGVVEKLRTIKSAAEIEATTSALALAEKAFLQLLATIRPGMTEKEVAWELERAMREAGAQGLSFPVIVAAGPNSALPHAIPTDRQLACGEPILIDWGARLDEYCSDTTRTFVLKEPDSVFMKVFETVVTARDRAIDAICDGASGTEVDSVARDFIESSEFAGKFGHSLGHGTGLVVHEAPRLSPVKDDRLKTGMIVTVEPGIYIPGWGGIRMENQVVVEANGARVLNDPTPFDPIVEV